MDSATSDFPVQHHYPVATVEFKLDDDEIRDLGPADYPIQGAPTISAGRFTAELANRKSPAAGEADALYRTAIQFGVNPAVALGFFAKESTFGTDPNGLVRQTRDWGNLVQAKNPARTTGQTVRYNFTVGGKPTFHDFPVYKSWADGLADFCDLLTDPQGVYQRRGLRTVAQVLPIYAPSSDGNDPGKYVRQVVQWVTAWSDQPAGPPAGPAAPMSLDAPVLGPPTGTLAQVVAFVQAGLPADSEYKGDVATILGYYWQYAPAAGVDPFLAAIQCVHETDGLRSYWSGRPRRNPAGLGIPDQADPNVGLSFATWEAAVQAHLGHILNFALASGTAGAAQRPLMDGDPVRAEVGGRQGTARTVRDLGRCWAGSDAYGAALVTLAQTMQKS